MSTTEPPPAFFTCMATHVPEIPCQSCGYDQRPVIGSPGLNCQGCGALPDEQHGDECTEGGTGGPVWPS